MKNRYLYLREKTMKNVEENVFYLHEVDIRDRDRREDLSVFFS